MNENTEFGITSFNMRGHATLLVVDDHPAIGFALTTYFQATPNVEVLTCLPNADDLINIVKRNKVNIVITQLGMDHAIGYKTIDIVHRLAPDVKVIVYSQCENEICVENSIRIGASGYVSKRSDLVRVQEAVRAVLEGGSYLDPGLSAAVMNKLLDQKRSSAVFGHERLTNREIKILNCVADGQRNKEVARELMISERTVKYHIRSIFEKLGVSSRTAMVKIALSENLISH